MMNKVKVLIIDDSIFFRKVLIDNLSKYSHIEIIGYAIDAYDAQNKIPRLKPDVVTCDIEMPGMNGIEFLKKLIPTNPIPVVLVSSLNLNVFEALSSGAVDFVRKPDMRFSSGVNSFIGELAAKIRIASRAKVRLPRGTTPAAVTAAQRTPAPSPLSGLRDSSKPMFSRSPRMNSMIIALGASTGGTEATLAVLKELPPDTPGILVVQHMPEGFTKMYAERLNRLCHMEVAEAKNGDKVARGKVLIAPGDLHMRLVKIGTGYTVSCLQGEKISGHRPSVDALFKSVASIAGANSIGIIMTGMGSDGANGLLEMKKAGAYTIGQDKESCVVYGMPMVAKNIGAVTIQSSCENIPNVLKNYLLKL